MFVFEGLLIIVIAVNLLTFVWATNCFSKCSQNAPNCKCPELSHKILKSPSATCQPLIPNCRTSIVCARQGICCQPIAPSLVLEITEPTFEFKLQRPLASHHPILKKCQILLQLCLPSLCALWHCTRVLEGRRTLMQPVVAMQLHSSRLSEIMQPKLTAAPILLQIATRPKIQRVLSSVTQKSKSD